jgi:hypothetical protein
LADGQKSVEIRLGELKAAAKSLAYNVGLLSDNKQFGGYNFNEVCQNGAVDTSLEAQRGLQELHELLLRKDEHFREEYDVALSQVQALRVELTSVVEAQKEYIGVLTSQIAELSMALETERRLNHELTTMLNSCVTEDAIDSMVSGRLDSIDMEKIQGYGADSICFTSQEALKEAVDLTVRSDIARLNHLIKESTNVEIQEVLKLIREAEATRLEHLREQDLVTSRDPTTSCDKCITIGEAKSMIHEEVAEQFSTQHKCEKIAASPPVLSTAEPDHAQRGAGAIVMHEFTSATYLRPRDRGSAADVFASVLDSMSDYFGIENGIGRPEDALSHRVTLGQCWAMNVGFPCVNVASLHLLYSSLHSSSYRELTACLRFSSHIPFMLLPLLLITCQGMHTMQEAIPIRYYELIHKSFLDMKRSMSHLRPKISKYLASRHSKVLGG